MEQCIITEQTLIRLKELESEIAQLDYSIGEEKKRKYADVTKESIEHYLHSVIYGDIDTVDVRKLIVKSFICEVQLYNDKVIISYNFTDSHPSYLISKAHSILLETISSHKNHT